MARRYGTRLSVAGVTQSLVIEPEAEAEFDVIVLANMDPPAAERVAELVRTG